MYLKVASYYWNTGFSSLTSSPLPSTFCPRNSSVHDSNFTYTHTTHITHITHHTQSHTVTHSHTQSHTAHTHHTHHTQSHTSHTVTIPAHTLFCTHTLLFYKQVAHSTQPQCNVGSKTDIAIRGRPCTVQSSDIKQKTTTS